ncbi:MAG: hypothetical protein HRU70_03580 [Phycisphaeraceae bacterium]|nr:MAG: hypothetical protein HRU70_03580 [Phycisphaeraceae bacterium]
MGPGTSRNGSGITRGVRGLAWVAAVGVAGWGVLWSGCGPSYGPAPGAVGSAGAVGADGSGAAAPADLVLSEEAWTFDSSPGRVIRTVSYAVHTTMEGGLIVDRAPAFLERALVHYTTTLGVLPRPPRTMETYLLSTRPQWNRLTRTLLGAEAEPFLRIERGGFSHRGRGVYYDIGPKDTLTIAAHEGWHQYVQTTFRDALPVWLDEGVATYMEGFRWDPKEPDRPVFLPWSNLERYETLRWTAARGRLMPLGELLRSSPQSLMEQDPRSPLRYYAQVWGLIHFLREGEGGKYSPALSKLLLDASQGRVGETVREAMGGPAARAFATRRDGTVVFSAYFTPDLDRLDQEFRAFIDEISSRGHRQKVSQGKSPILD